MQIGGLTSEQLPNLRIRACYEDIIRKTKCITYKVDIINTMHKDLLDRLPSISENDNIILSGEISDCFEKIYSCMEYTASVFREILREKGNLDSKFHKLMQKTIKNPDRLSMYADSRVVNFITRALDWYAIVHDIRSEETHYSMGIIEIVDSKLFYKIRRQTGRETVYDLLRIVKKLPERQEAEYRLEIGAITQIYMGFIGSIKQLEEVITMKSE